MLGAAYATRAARARETAAFVAWASGAPLVVAALYYVPALHAAPDAWPAPLDDVYIHFDFARALASGHPMEWIAGQGYSSGETSPAYAAVLAVGHLLGFHRERLGLWSALAAWVCVASMLRTLGRVLRADRLSPPWAAWLAVPVMLSCGTLDFAWWSGMEVALFGAVAARFLFAVDEARTAGADVRAARQWRVGLLGGLLVLVRPESAVVVGVAMFLVARRAWTSSALAACARVAAPGALVTLGMAALNRALTGDYASAGARLKLLSSNPFATDEDRARDYVMNLVALVRAMRIDLGDGAGHGSYLLALLAALSLTSRRTRALGALCLGGAVSFTLVASLNGAARYQNLRDYMPGVGLLLFGAALGLSALASRRLLAVRALGATVAVLGTLLGASHVTAAARLYARACKNIHDQQVTVGRRLRAEAPGAIVLVGDAGAIPYLSELAAVDAFGLGGYHRLPFVRAAVHGEAATLELIERLPVRERPTIMALYPNWFPGITGRFGRERERVTITDNVICGGVTKGIYDADWTALRGDTPPSDELFGGRVLDEVDVADIVSEEAHAYRSPAPLGGFTLFDVRDVAGATRRFDAGRVTPQGYEESFEVVAAAPPGSVLVLRVDETPVAARVVVESGGGRAAPVPLDVQDAPSRAAWSVARAVLPGPLARGDRLHVEVTRGALHDFHAWLIGGKP